MQKHNILGKKAAANAAFKEKVITVCAWVFISCCLVLVVHLSTVGLRSLFLTSNPQFSIKTLDIQANGLPEHSFPLVSTKSLRESLAIKEGTNIFEVDLKEVRKKIIDNIAINRAQVAYIYPDTIKIRYVEEAPIARLSNSNTINAQALVLPPGRADLQLPVIRSKSYKSGQHLAEDKSVKIPLDFIRFHEKFSMSYSAAKEFLGKEDFAVLQLLKIKFIHFEAPNTLLIKLRAVPEVLLSSNCQLRLNCDNFELGIRRACVALLNNAKASKITHKIDARYSSTPTE